MLSIHCGAEAFGRALLASADEEAPVRETSHRADIVVGAAAGIERKLDICIVGQCICDLTDGFFLRRDDAF